MKKESHKLISEVAYFWSLGLSVSFSIFIGLGCGVYLDGLLGISPWLTFIFLVIGILAGFRNIGLMIKKIN